MTGASLRANNLSVNKRGVSILHDIRFTLPKGKIVGLIGPSGSGKTTLMRAVVGVERFQGALEVLGLPAGSKQLRKKIGYVTQTPAVYDDLTVEQNLGYFSALTGASRRRVEELIETIDLTQQKNQLAGTLSGGQKARVSLAIALLGDPEILVLDEPTVGLDPLLRRRLWDLFEELAKAGKTLIISSHVMDEAKRCEIVLLLRNGRLLWHDTQKWLLATTGKSSIEEAFISMITEEGK